MNEDSYEGQLTNPLSLNLYTYTDNNPLRYIDPSGHCFTDWLGKGVCKKAWNATKEFVSDVEWKEVGLGITQMAGGGFELAGGFTLATGGTAASGGLLGGITVTAGGVLMVDGASNISGGFSRFVNGLKGSADGDTLNFVKNTFKAASSNGEEYYNYYQLGIGVLSLSMAAKQLATQSGQVSKSLAGYFQLEKEGVTVGYTVTDATISKISINYMTSDGVRYKTVEINTLLIAGGIIDGAVTIFNMNESKKTFD